MTTSERIGELFTWLVVVLFLYGVGFYTGRDYERKYKAQKLEPWQVETLDQEYKKLENQGY